MLYITDYRLIYSKLVIIFFYKSHYTPILSMYLCECSSNFALID